MEHWVNPFVVSVLSMLLGRWISQFVVDVVCGSVPRGCRVSLVKVTRMLDEDSRVR